MRTGLIIIVALFALTFGGLGGWYLAHTRSSESAAEQYESWAKAQKLVPVLFVVTAPPETPKDQTLYLSGSAPELMAWDAAGVPMDHQPDGTWTKEVMLMSGIEHEFKVTRGTWGTVERGPNNQDMPNRTCKPEGTSPKVTVTVASWNDEGKSIPGRITTTGNMRVHRKMHCEALKNDRDLAVYLPPGYDDPANAEKRYPVLYMNDGQNLFNEVTSYQGVEWKLDEAAEKLITDGKIDPLIIVGIFNSEQRTREFTPKSLGKSGSDGAGEVYGQFVVETVKPFIDSMYRTNPDRAHTGIGGSSMGALIALSIVKQYPDKFGKIALLTPHLWCNGKPIYAMAGEDLGFMKGAKVWLDMGSAGGDNYPGKDPLADAQQFAKKLESSELARDKDLKYSEYPGGEHKESAWQTRCDQVLMWLYGK